MRTGPWTSRDRSLLAHRTGALRCGRARRERAAARLEGAGGRIHRSSIHRIARYVRAAAQPASVGSLKRLVLLLMPRRQVARRHAAEDRRSGRRHAGIEAVSSASQNRWPSSGVRRFEPLNAASASPSPAGWPRRRSGRLACAALLEFSQELPASSVRPSCAHIAPDRPATGLRASGRGRFHDATGLARDPRQAAHRGRVRLDIRKSDRPPGLRLGRACWPMVEHHRTGSA